MSKRAVIILILSIYSVHGAKIKCGSSTSSKSFTLTNPDSPPNDCVYKIKKSNSKVCQLRIDFEMNLAPPTFPSYKNELSYTQCVDDYVVIGEYNFCGRETNQHIYIPFEESSSEIRIFSTPRSAGSQLPKLSWKFSVRQLECTDGIFSSSSDLVAPAGCLQYFTKSTGTITSFNFNDGLGAYSGKLNYAVCFQRTPETHGIKLTGDKFRMGYNTNKCSQEVEEDFLFVPLGFVQELGARDSVFCGSKLKKKTVISQNPGPISLVFNSANRYQYDNSPRGFSLSYELF